MSYTSFDLEIYKAVEGEDWAAQRPFGISCAAIYEGAGASFWYFEDGDQPRSVAMSRAGCCKVVRDLQRIVSDGSVLVTVNGLAFDFSVLAEESGMVNECADLALNHHCDLLFMSVCHYGWYVGLDALCAGAGVESKLHEVVLSDGSAVPDMSGAMAPRLWQDGEFDVVLAYLKQDVRATLEVAEMAVFRRMLAWRSRRGGSLCVPVTSGRLPIVAECLTWPLPDTSWMDSPPSRQGMMEWMK